jgi:Na+/H+-dicarboxylate symporter
MATTDHFLVSLDIDLIAVVNICLPVGAVINIEGSALYEGSATVMLAVLELGDISFSTSFMLGITPTTPCQSCAVVSMVSLDFHVIILVLLSHYGMPPSLVFCFVILVPETMIHYTNMA